VTCQKNSRCVAAFSASRVTPLLWCGQFSGVRTRRCRRHAHQVVPVGLGVVAAQVHQLRHEAAHLPPLEMHEQLNALAMPWRDGGIGQVDAGLEHAGVKRRSAWSAELAWMVESVPECPVLSAWSSRTPTAAHLADENAVRAVAQCRPQQVRES